MNENVYEGLHVTKHVWFARVAVSTFIEKFDA